MTAIWWIRRDLRLNDNLTLQTALQHQAVIPLFILDPYFDSVPSRRRNFLIGNLRSLREDLADRGSGLLIRRGQPGEVLRDVLADSSADMIYAEEDFTPYARRRDAALSRDLPLKLVQGQLVHHPLAVHKVDGSPYIVYTPFSNTWKNLPAPLAAVPPPEKLPVIPDLRSEPLPVVPGEKYFPAGEQEALSRLSRFTSDPGGLYAYGERRDRLDLDGTSSLSPYLHFGVLGLRTAAAAARQALTLAPDSLSRKSAATWLNELIWREFYVHILYHFPRVRGSSFRPQYDRIRWQNDPEDFRAWTEGKTGYPVVDAAMRQLLETGWMHNRARMITASFLVKDLLIDWRWGERWFIQNLLDADLAANNGGWQWTAGTGTDAAPYFRVFNPILQSRKFDPLGEYIRHWVPELAGLSSAEIHSPWEKGRTPPGYPEPLIDHKFARQRTLAAYKAVRS